MAEDEAQAIIDLLVEQLHRNVTRPPLRRSSSLEQAAMKDAEKAVISRMLVRIAAEAAPIAAAAEAFDTDDLQNLRKMTDAQRRLADAYEPRSINADAARKAAQRYTAHAETALRRFFKLSQGHSHGGGRAHG